MSHKPTYEELEKRVQELERVERELKQTEETFTRIFSELKQKEAALENNKSMLDATNRMARVGGWELDVDTLAVTWTEETYRIHELPFDCTPSLQDAIKFFHPVDKGQLQQAIQRALKTGESYDMEIRFITAKGKHLWTRTLCRPEMVGGKVVKLKGTFQDITGRKLAEESLRNRESFLKSLLDAIPIPVFYKDPDGRYLGFNKSFESFFGKSEDEIKGKTVFDINPPDLADIYYSRDQELFDTGEKQVYESQVQNGLGDRRDVVFSKAVFHDPEGNIGGLIGTIQDITDRKQVEDRIRKSEEKYRKLYEGAAIGIFHSTFEGRFLDVNPALARMLGYETPQEVLASIYNIAEQIYVAPQVRDDVMAQSLAKGETVKVENRYRRKDGSEWDAYLYLRHVFDSKGQPVCLQGFVEDITDRKKAADLLKESETRYRSVLETINEGVILQSVSGEILTWNKGAETIFGLSAEEVIGRTSEGREWPTIREDGSTYEGKEHPSMRALRTGTPHRNEIMGVYKPSGELRWISVNTNPLFRDHERKPYAVAISFADITEIKKEKDQSQMYLDATTDGIWTWNFKTNALFFSPKYYRMLGYKPDAFPADYDHWMGLIHPEDREKALAVALEYLRTKPDVYENEFRLRTSHGDYRWIRARGKVASRDTDGEAVLMVGNHEDITERKKAERALLESKQKYQSMVENVPIGVSLLNKHMEIIELNKQMREWFPAVDPARKPICYKAFNDPPKETICSWCPTSKTLSDGRVHESITETPAAGSVRNYRIVSSPIIDSEGEVKGAIEMVEDMTETLKLEEQLRKAQRMESIGNLAGGIAHDFNNILFPIIGMSEMLMEDLPSGSGERENAEEIFKAGKRGSDLVSQILAFSRQSEHKMMPTRIQNVLEEVITLSRSTIPAYIEIKQDIQQDCGMVLADPSQIHQVGMNIITNAYHAVESNGGQISIALKQTLLEAPESIQMNVSPGTYAVLSISDTGHGMPEERIAKIFDPYFTTKEQGKGTGLGLAVVYGIVKAHGGSIKVSSEVGKGTTFDVYLPLMKKSSGTESTPEAEVCRGGNERILMVDDEVSVVKLEKQMLERLGYRVTSYMNSADALDAFKDTPSLFDLVVTDMSMPGIPGDELAGGIRSIRSDVPIIICTGFSERIHEDNLKRMGIDGILMKPILKSELAITVRKVLDEAKSEKQD